jgi:hypothetical protein
MVLKPYAHPHIEGGDFVGAEVVVVAAAVLEDGPAVAADDLAGDPVFAAAAAAFRFLLDVLKPLVGCDGGAGDVHVAAS